MALDEEEDVHAAIKSLEVLVNSNPTDPSAHFDLGVLLWENGDARQEMREKAVEHFVMAAKLNPQNGAAFRYLGHYYARVSPEPQRALKCYQRAVTLDPNDSDAGEAICDLLDEGGKESLVLSVCLEASEKSAKAFWAFRRLGFFQAYQKKWSEAIQSLQHAIRGFPMCADLWETLGLAYHRMGMFTAALKSYERAIELDDSRFFALAESGNISLMLGSFRKGVEQFGKALKISPHNVSAHYGLASALLALAKECASLGALRWATSLLEEASEVAVHGTSLASHFSCSWKLLGDIQLMHAKCYPWVQEVESEHTDEKTFDYSIHKWKMTCFLSARSACCSYQSALHLAPWLANAYADVAIASDLCWSLKEPREKDPSSWPIAEKMCLGSILLESENEEHWVALGCLANNAALKQHALIRGLQLNVCLADAWAFLGKFYREQGKIKMAEQAFDRARSIEPSLALPWAGMSADAAARKLDKNEAYDCCLRAIQISPLAEFQVGFAKLALRSDCLPSSEVFGAIQQALERVPHYPESHNLNGLVCESRSDYQSAITSYRLALCALICSDGKSDESRRRDISINLARSLCMAGYSHEAAEQCEVLKQKGQLDAECLQIYALCLWQLGKNDMALTVTRSLASNILSMEKNLAGASISFICRMLYQVSGQESTIISILKMPKELFESSKISFVISAIHVLDSKNRLDSIVSGSRSFLTSQDEIISMHILITLGKLLSNGREDSLGIKSGIDHLKKALHMFPTSSRLRNFLSYLLLISKERGDDHLANRCLHLDISDHQNDEVVKSAFEIVGAETVACYARVRSEKSLFITSRHQLPSGPGAIQLMQTFLHQEPWNFNARYLLTLNCFQKAREEKFPLHVCQVLERLIAVALSNDFSPINDSLRQYQHFQLLLCAAEVNLQQGNVSECFRRAKAALACPVHDSRLFFGHLLLCRAYSAISDAAKVDEEYRKCLELGTDLHMGWISLKFIESRYGLQDESNVLRLGFEDCSKGAEDQQNIWTARFDMVEGLLAISTGDFLAAEYFFREACSIADGESCFFLCHGAVCMELARQHSDAQYISRAVRSLKRARDVVSSYPLPYVSLLLGQAEASLGSKSKWENSLKNEWLSWPPGTKPAEILFQMHLLTRQLDDGSALSSSPMRWILQAIHMNPSSSRYWKFLLKNIT